MRKIRTYRDVDPDAGRELLDQVVEQRRRLAERLAPVRALVAVVSGKGGVGKSAVTANLAAALALEGLRVGALDADLNGPSLGRMLGAAGARLGDDAGGVLPPRGIEGIKVVSMEHLQEEGAPLRWKGADGHASLWRGAAETAALRELLADVAWGELDCLLIDVPPGVDKIARLLELVSLRGALLVTTPSEISCRVVARSAGLLREAGLERVALVANMTHRLCDACGHPTPLFEADATGALAADTGLETWARIPFDGRLAVATDEGRSLAAEAPHSTVAAIFRALARRVVERWLPEEAEA